MENPLHIEGSDHRVQDARRVTSEALPLIRRMTYLLLYDESTGTMSWRGNTEVKAKDKEANTVLPGKPWS